MKKWLVTFLLISVSFIALKAEVGYHFTITPQIKEIYTAIVELRLEEAQQLCQQARTQDRQNQMILHMEQYIDFFTVFILEEEEVFKQAEKRINERRDDLDRHFVEHPYQRLVQAEVELQFALIRLKFNQKLKAGSSLLTAYKLLEQNLALYPDFKESLKSMSVMHSLAASLPGWVKAVVGVSGSLEEGLQESHDYIKYATEHSSLFETEGRITRAYILTYLYNDAAQALQVLKKIAFDTSRSPLLTFVYSSIAHMGGYNEDAIATLKSRKILEGQLSFYYLDLLLGKCLLYKMDATAIKHIRAYIEYFEGMHFVKEAYQKLAWAELLLNHDEAAYYKTMKTLKDKGHTLVDEDKHAQYEAVNATIPDATLLRARLLYDGSYLKEALSTLRQEAINPNDTRYPEYLYRKARIHQGLNQVQEALNTYEQLLSTFALDENAMTCNAALQCGLIYSDMRNWDQAKYYLTLCLSMDPPNYKSSLHQKAKTALDRIKGYE